MLFIPALCILLGLCIAVSGAAVHDNAVYASSENKKYIKWVDFGVSCAAMKQAMKYDIDSRSQKVKISWIDLLSIAALQNGGKFADKRCDCIDKTAKRLQNGEKIEDIVGQSKYFDYYKDAYTAVLGGMLGNYKRDVYD